MTKRELLELLEPFDNDVHLWMEVDAGIAPVGYADYQASGPEDEGPIILLAPEY